MEGYSSGKGYQVVAPHFVALVIVAQDGVIVNAAPILNWACNKPIAWFKQYVQRKGWQIHAI